jgi:hypothetical protein
MACVYAAPCGGASGRKLAERECDFPGGGDWVDLAGSEADECLEALRILAVVNQFSNGFSGRNLSARKLPKFCFQA